MEKLKQIMYGVTDFALMRAENAYFVDRTDLIRELEKIRYAVFLRPRRFGKSLLVSILQTYYDVDYAHRFGELFGGLKIAANPTDEHGQYLTLVFNFSGVDKRLDQVQESFDEHCRLVIDQFVEHYGNRLPRNLPEKVKEARNSNGKLESIIADGGTTGQLVDSFQAREIAKGDNFVSFLYYLGLLTIGGVKFDRMAIGARRSTSLARWCRAIGRCVMRSRAKGWCRPRSRRSSTWRTDPTSCRMRASAGTVSSTSRSNPSFRAGLPRRRSRLLRRSRLMAMDI